VGYRRSEVRHLGPHSILPGRYGERREVLAELALEGPHVRTPPWYAGGGADVLAASGQQGLEGVVAKRLDSAYLPGRRSPLWVKVKQVRTQEVVIGGSAPRARPPPPVVPPP